MKSGELKRLAGRLDAFLDVEFGGDGKPAQFGMQLRRIVELLQNAFSAHPEPPRSCVVRQPVSGILIPAFPSFV
jgi:hypothetical protein